jgi:hypothetical protein
MVRTRVLIAALVCVILRAYGGHAQGLYVTAGVGYSFGAGTQSVGTSYTSGGPSESREGNYGSYGEGFKFGASGGYMFSRNLGAELGLSYWLGQAFELTDTQQSYVSHDKKSGAGFVGAPSIVLSLNLDPVNPYARFGLVIGVLKMTEELRYQMSNETDEVTNEETGNLAFGYAGALGIVVPAGGGVGFFAEAVIHSVTYSPYQREMTRYVVNGVDRLPSVQNKVMEFRESYNSDEAHVVQAVRRPFSSIGIVLGARFSL